MRPLFLALLLTASTAWGCPFCELGGQDTAFFIVALFVPFVVGMTFLLIAAVKSGALSRHNDAGQRFWKQETSQKDHRYE